MVNKIIKWCSHSSGSEAKSLLWERWLRGGLWPFLSCRLMPSPVCVGRSKPCSRTLIASTALSDTLNVVFNVWSGHQSQMSGLRGRIGKWVYVWSEGFEGLVTLSSCTLSLREAEALQRITVRVQRRGRTFIECWGELVPTECWEFHQSSHLSLHSQWHRCYSDQETEAQRGQAICWSYASKWLNYDKNPGLPGCLKLLVCYYIKLPPKEKAI